MTISGRPEIGLEDVPWTLAAHRIDILRTSIDPKMVQILTEIFKTLIKKLIFIKSIRQSLIHSEDVIIDYIRPSFKKKSFPVHRPGGLKRAYWNFFFHLFKKLKAGLRLGIEQFISTI